jgi:hypothetical protein
MQGGVHVGGVAWQGAALWLEAERARALRGACWGVDAVLQGVPVQAVGACSQAVGCGCVGVVWVFPQCVAWKDLSCGSVEEGVCTCCEAHETLYGVLVWRGVWVVAAG